MSSLFISGGIVIDPAKKEKFSADVLLENGLIDGSADSYFGHLAAKDNAHTALAGYVEWLSYTFNKTEPRLMIWMTKGDLDPDNYGEEVVFTDVKIIIDEGWIPGGYKNEEGEDVSSRAVKEKLRELVKNEDPHNPLSDDKLARLLNDDGLPVARRTIAKYRELLGIPNTRLRKKY